MATEQIGIHIVLPLIVGIIIGIVEAYFVYEDEGSLSGGQFLADMWHGFLFAIGGTLIASNVPWILAQGWLPKWINSLLIVDAMGRSIVVSIIITLFMMAKMVVRHGFGRMGMGIATGFREKFWHKIVIGVAVGFAPYYIFALYAPLSGIQKAIPWLPF